MQTVVVLLALMGSALAVPTSRIVGGSNTTVETYPYIANLQYGVWATWWHQACGGSVITTTSILSAAHCFYGESANNWRVVLGSSLASSTTNVYLVNRFILHNNYNHNTMVNDIALLRLSTGIVYTSTIQPARIPGVNFVVTDGAPVTAIGWGNTEYQGDSSEQLMDVELNAFNRVQCTNRYEQLKQQPGYSNFPSVTNNMICALGEGGGKDACHGDDGGPLSQFNDIVVGILSFGYQCGSDFYPLVSTRVSAYTPWIQSNV